MKNFEEIIRRMKVYFFIVLSITILYLIIGWDSNEWKTCGYTDSKSFYLRP